MALLLQCLRDARTMSGDLDLLPPPGEGRPFDVRSLLRNCDDLGDATSRSAFDGSRAAGGDAGRAARDVHRHGSLLLAVNPTPLVAGSLREIPEECHWSLQVL